MIISMTGCQLAETKTDTNPTVTAEEPKEKKEGEDIFCGLFAAYGEYNELLEDKIYATKEGTNYKFNGLNGSYMAIYRVKKEKSEDNYMASAISNTLSDRATCIGGNEEESNADAEISATQKVVFNNNVKYLITYPIYMDAENQMYILNEPDAVQSDSEISESHSQTLSEKYTVTEDGKAKTYSTTATITVKAVDELKYVVVKEMSANDELVASSSFNKSAFKPCKDEEGMDDYTEATLKLKKNTDYLLVEDHVVTADKKEKTVRRIVNIDEEDTNNNYIICDFAEDNGIVFERAIHFER